MTRVITMGLLDGRDASGGPEERAGHTGDTAAAAPPVNRGRPLTTSAGRVASLSISGLVLLYWRSRPSDAPPGTISTVPCAAGPRKKSARSSPRIR